MIKTEIGLSIALIWPCSFKKCKQFLCILNTCPVNGQSIVPLGRQGMTSPLEATATVLRAGKSSFWCRLRYALEDGTLFRDSSKRVMVFSLEVYVNQLLTLNYLINKYFCFKTFALGIFIHFRIYISRELINQLS